MKTVTECAVCAWRKDCKLKYTYESSGLYCKEFTRDLTLTNKGEQTGTEKEVDKSKAV